ncbi:MAG: 30S ribosomal protein S1 [Terriglobales bacterium]
MPDPNTPDSQPASETEESFDNILSRYEKSHAHQAEGRKQIEGTIISVSGESVYVDIGFKTEGILPLSAFAGREVKPGDTIPVSVTGRDPEGYYQLTRSLTARPRDWSALEQAFADKAAIVGTVTGVIKGGLSVDVGVRAFLPASRSGVRDAAEMEKLVGQEIRCRITKLDVADEDVVVDRRALLEEEERGIKQRRYSEVKEGETVTGVVRSLTDYGAFVDIGGVDGLLHVGDMSWSRIDKPSDVLSPGQQIEAKVLKVDAEKQRISLGMKQLQPDPWSSAADRYKVGERVRGTVARVAEFGAFVELEPGIEGLVHVSEMSWSRKLKNASTIVKPGETVEVVVLGVNAAERRISLGLKQALGDPWAEAAEPFPVGAVVEGPVTSLTNFGAFVQLAEGVDGMIHIGDISAEKRIRHPREVLRVGETVRAQVLALDKTKRQLRLGMKQLLPTGWDDYIAEHKPGDVVTGRIIELSGAQAAVELGEGVRGTCRIGARQPAPEESKTGAKADLSSLSSMLQARWKGGASRSAPDEIHTGQIRSFRIASLDPVGKHIELELA